MTCSGIVCRAASGGQKGAFMSQEENSKRKSASESFGEMFEAFGNAVSQIFDDPELKGKAKEFGKSAVESAEAFASRFKDEEVREKFRDVARAAQDFAKSMAECFTDAKEKRDVESRSKE